MSCTGASFYGFNFDPTLPAPPPAPVPAPAPAAPPGITSAAVVLGNPCLTVKTVNAWLQSPQADPDVFFAAITTLAAEKAKSWALYDVQGSLKGNSPEASKALRELLGPGSQVAVFYASASNGAALGSVQQSTDASASSLLSFLETGSALPVPPKPMQPSSVVARVVVIVGGAIAAALLIYLLYLLFSK